MLKLLHNENEIEVGCDEVGRGALAGPVVAACVVFSNEIETNEILSQIKDSKLLSKKKREELSEYIKNYALDWSVGFVDNKRIDEINILNATFEAMHKALDKITIDIDHIIVDGNRFKKYKNIKNTCIIKGDNEYLSIASASIIAKVERDKYMTDLANQPALSVYKFEKNSGYGTKIHKEAISKYGVSDYHRMSFCLT
jgi:ribonuclease HII